MSTHTPGPWTSEQTRGNNIYEHRIMSGYKEIATMSTKGYFLKGPNETEHAQAIKADASLIAAAPDLLSALEALIESVSPHIFKLGVKKGFHEMLALEAAKTAVQKAKGE